MSYVPSLMVWSPTMLYHAAMPMKHVMHFMMGEGDRQEVCCLVVGYLMIICGSTLTTWAILLLQVMEIMEIVRLENGGKDPVEIIAARPPPLALNMPQIPSPLSVFPLPYPPCQWIGAPPGYIPLCHLESTQYRFTTVATLNGLAEVVLQGI